MAMTNLGACIEPKPPPLMKRVTPNDIGLAHMAPLPGSDYKVRLMQYNQRKREFEHRHNAEIFKEILKTRQGVATMERTTNLYHYKQFKSRVEKKIQEMNATIPARREKLRALFLKERKEQFLETIEKAQQYKALRLQEIKTKIEEHNRRAEMERQQFVAQKRLQQTIENLDATRQAKQHRHLLETKRCQLLQIQEKESEREAERELDRRWHDLAMKIYDAKTAREENDALERKLKYQADLEIVNKQVEGKRLLLQELNRIQHEDRLEIQKLLDEIRQEKIAEAEREKQKKAALLKSVKDQINEKLERKRYEADAERAYLELEKQTLIAEQPKPSKAEQRREIDLYRNYCNQISEAKQRDEEAYARMTEEDRLRLEARQNENRRALCEYRQEMIRSLKKERDEMKQARKAKEAEEKALEEQYAKLIREKLDFNRKLDAEKESRLIADQKQLANDLKDQHCYRRRQEQEEIQEWNGIIDNGIENEKREQQLIEAILNGTLSTERGSSTHPFERPNGK